MDNQSFDENADPKKLIEEQKRIIENQAHEIEEKNRIIELQSQEIETLKNQIREMQGDKKPVQPEEKPFVQDPAFQGIINNLQKRTKKIFKEIDITSSSVYNDSKDYSPKNAISYYNPKRIFSTKTNMNQWICFDFKDHKVVPKKYSIRSCDAPQNDFHPRNWVIEGSNDNNNWVALDQQSNCLYLNGPSYVHTFDISNPKNDEYRFLRMRSTGCDWKNLLYLCFNCIEFHGEFH